MFIKNHLHNYINSYRKKFQEDFYEIRNKVNSTLERINRPINSISDEQITTMIKNAKSLRVIRYRTLEEEINQPNTQLIGMIIYKKNILFN